MLLENIQPFSALPTVCRQQYLQATPLTHIHVFCLQTPVEFILNFVCSNKI